MRIVHVIQQFKPTVSGPATLVDSLSSALRRQGHESIVFTTTLGTRSQEASAEVLGSGVEIRRYATAFKMIRYNFVPRLGHKLSRLRADVLHVHQWRSHIADAAIVYALRHRIPVVLQAHGTASARTIVRNGRGGPLLEAPYVAYDLLFRHFLSAAPGAILATTQQEATQCLDYGFPRDRIHVIPLGIDVDAYSVKRYSNPDPKGSFRILLVGRLERNRNVELLIRSLALLQERGVDFVCRIVGPEVRLSFAAQRGYVNRLRSLAVESGVEGRVEFAGLLQGQDLAKEYASADVFVYPSLYENFGYTILEAAVAGLPLLTTRTGVARDLVKDGVSGFQIDESDPLDLVSKLATLAANPQLRRHLGTNAAQLSRARYDMSILVARYLGLYRALLGST